MREKKKFGKRNSNSRPLPSNENLKNTFGVVNKGCDSEQIVSFIKKSCGKDICKRDKRMTDIEYQ